MSAKRAAKRNLFTMLGWLVWKIAALFGSRYARRKLDEHDAKRRGGNAVTRRLHRSTDRGNR